MTKIIVNADDFGLSEAVNYGIISAYKNGIVRSTTIMPGMPAFEHAIGLLKENKGLGCGVHMTLSVNKPILNCHKTIVDENGNFYKRITNEIIEEKFDLDEVYEEFSAQIDKVINSGVKVDHLDSHHHVHTLKALKPVIERILEKYKLPIRGGFEYELNYDKVIPMTESFYSDNVTDDYFENFINEIKGHEIIDIMCHPAFIDENLVNSTSYVMQRIKEYSILTSKKVQEFLTRNNIELINYSKL